MKWTYGLSPTTGLPLVCDDDLDFLNELNNFFGRFEALNKTPSVKTVSHQDKGTLP